MQVDMKVIRQKLFIVLAVLLIFFVKFLYIIDVQCILLARAMMSKFTFQLPHLEALVFLAYNNNLLDMLSLGFLFIEFVLVTLLLKHSKAY